MATLHVVSHSPFGDQRLDSCLRILGAGDGLLLCGDAAYALQTDCEPLRHLEALPAHVELFALEEDVRTRRLVAPARVRMIDYAAFVDLSCRFDKVNTWL